jgi:hypothetical protein
MTDAACDNRAPGTLLLKVARMLFDELVVDAIVLPTIADLQQEIRASGGDRRRRLAARWRGYRAFWTIVAITPFACHSWPARPRMAVISPSMSLGVGISLTVFGLLAFAAPWPVVRAWTYLAAMGGSIFAVIMHRWHLRHPTEVAPAPHVRSGRLQIDLAATPIDGNVGGLMCVIGSIAILIAGLPILRSFFLAAVVGGVGLALLLLAWRTTHPSRGPQFLIAVR